MVTREAVLGALRGVRDDVLLLLGDIVALGLVQDLAIGDDAQVSFTLAFTTQSPKSRATMHSMAARLVGQLPGVAKVQVKMGSGGAAGAATQAAAGTAAAPP